MTNNGKAKIENSFDGLKIIVPSKKNWFALLFGSVWMGGWFFGFVSAFSIVFSSANENTGADGFLFFWLIGWTIGGIAIAIILLWGFFGKEKFISERNFILFEKTVFGFGKKKKLEITTIKNFRTEMNNKNDMRGWGFWGLGPGNIKFDYGLKTYSFGLGVDEAEANYIVELLKEQFKEQ